MPARSSVSKLPPEVRAWLDRALVDRNFSEYRSLTEELRERGYEISKSALHRYGAEFEDRLQLLRVATEQARAIAEVAGDDENVVGDALTRLAQQKAFEVLLKMETECMDVSLPQLAKAIADLNKSGIAVKKHMAEAREKARKVANEIITEAKAKGLSDETAEQIRQKILGIV